MDQLDITCLFPCIRDNYNLSKLRSVATCILDDPLKMCDVSLVINLTAHEAKFQKTLLIFVQSIGTRRLACLALCTK